MGEILKDNLEPKPQEHQEVESKLRFQISDLAKIFRDEIFSPERLMVLLEKQYPETYNKGAGVWEGYTLERHTLMVMGQFEKYFGHKTLPAGIDKNKFRLILALHDVGKPEAIARGGKHLQHEYTQQYILELFTSLGIDKKHTDLALVLVSGDPVGKYIRSKANTSNTKKAIEDMASKVKIPVDEFFELLCVYFKIDAGSYTENAGGLRSLDDLFVFDEEHRELKFALHVQEKIDQLGFKRNSFP